jgi:hypothetical protein
MYRCIIRTDQSLANMSVVAQFDERLRDALQVSAARDNAGKALADSLRLQQSTQQRAMTPAKKHGRRRKGEVIDLDKRTLFRPKRRRAFKAFLAIEAAAAVVAVAVLVIYLFTHHDTVT